MGPGDLSKALAPLAVRTDPRILVGHETFDDAGIVLLSADVALVQTLDFFAPIVDDPYTFGGVAAANALSDVFAMGGTPLSALCIAAFPTQSLPIEVLSEILRGAQDKVHEAGASIVGGHTVTDDEVKFGLSVTGTVHPERILSNANARPGEVLVLTKPIGTGIVATAVKRGLGASAHESAMVASMLRLNRVASETAVRLGVRCATDVTGFGLIGHALHIARASDVTVEFETTRIPVLSGVPEAQRAGVKTGGAGRNEEFVHPSVHWGRVSDDMRALLTDPQTSGGLLVSVPRAAVPEYLERVEGAVVVGAVHPRGEHAIRLAE